MSKTKEKILEAGLKLFNRDGLVNVRLQHIADEAFISVGNLAYHFKNKEAILLAIYERFTKNREELLREFRVVPLFDNIDRLILHTFKLQQEYVFFFLDTLEVIRAYESVKKAHREMINSQVFQLKTILDFNVSRGALKAEKVEGMYDKLASQIRMTMDFWLIQEKIRTDSPLEEQAYRAAVWNLIIPNFTETGKLEYEQMLQTPYDFYF